MCGKASSLARMSDWQQRKVEQEIDLQSAVADAEEKQRLVASRAAAAHAFTPASLEEDLLASLFGGARLERQVPAGASGLQARGNAADCGGVMQALEGSGGQARGQGVSGNLLRLKQLVLEGETQAVTEAWSAAGRDGVVSQTVRGGARGGARGAHGTRGRGGRGARAGRAT